GNGNGSFSGIMTNGSSALSVTKNGTGMQTLAGGLINHKGTTTVNGGALVFSKTSALQTSILNNASVEINAVSGDDWILVGNGLSGGGTWIKTGAGRATFSSSAITASGTFEIRAGTLRNNNNLANWSGSSADMDISGGAILDLYADAIYVDQLAGSGVVQNGYGNPSGQSGSAAYFEKFVIGVANGSSTYQGVIRNNGGNNVAGAATQGGGIQLEKQGTGTITLAGANTYTGTTTVAAGTLQVNGSLSTGVLTVAAAGTVGGSGSLAGAVTNNGTLAPGSQGVGNLTINNTLTMAGGSKVAWEIADWAGSAGTGWDKLTATALNLTATSANRITIKPAGAALTNYTNSSASFVLVQTSSGIIGFSADKFTIDTSGLSGPQGTWAVQHSGNNLVLAYTANSDTNSNGILDAWEIARFGNANSGANSSNADPDGDGLSNLMEYALDTNPLANNANPAAIDFATLGDGKHLRLTVVKNPAATNLTYTVETCGTLAGWSAVDTTVESSTATQLIVRDNVTQSAAPHRFIRLRVTAGP
ncbi:MAG TPA: autotransporter-associated beta strand repeat-containing protein, partial [Luteolibacter sp.]